MKKRGGGGAKPNINKRRGDVRVAKPRDLRRDVESVWKNYPTVEQLVEYLCSDNSDKKMREYYRRHKRQPLTKCVENIVEILSRRNNSTDESDTPITKKRRKIDEKEETLQRIEAHHRQSDDVLNDSGGMPSSSVASASTLGGDDSSTSTSVDAVYEEKFEPEFDLMKSMIRENLRGKSNKEVKEVLELEVVDNKEVHLMNEEGKLCDGLSKINKNDNRDGNKSNRPLFEDLGGMDGVIDHLEKRVIVPLIHPDLNGYGVKPITGILLCGPPGCGKTTLARAIANESRVPFYNISSTELVSGVSGASEENIRELFSKANRTAPSIVFIDEIDAIASKRENLQSGMVVRIVTQLMTCMDEACSRVKPIRDNVGSESSHCRPGYVLVIGATNRPDAIDPALRRPGRFGCEISLGVPDEHARVEILSLLTCNLRVEGSFDLVKVARSTPGFVGADLKDLVDEATNLAMDRVSNKRKLELSKEQMNGAHTEKWWRSPFSDGEMKNFRITMADFEVAAKKVQPSSKREGFSNIPNVKWDDVGGLHLLRQAFERDIISRIKFTEFYEDSGLDMETGFLLYGPPGCGKTLIAKAVANEAGANFIYIKGPELLNKYVGESELAVRTLFIRARTCSPCILFFDEVDALTAKHDKEGGGCQLWKQLLIELDGAEQRRGVYVIGATNRPKDMDPALLRPGRFGKLIYVSLPSPDERGMILKALARNKLIDANVDLMALGKSDACENFSGADLNALINEAVMESIEDRRLASSSDWRSCSTAKTVKLQHFKRALKAIRPSVSDEQIRESLTA